MSLSKTCQLVVMVFLMACAHACGGSNVTDAGDKGGQQADVVLFPDMEFPEIPGHDVTNDSEDTAGDAQSDLGVDLGVDLATPDICDPNPCTHPPLPECNGAGTALLVYQSPGNCSPDGDEALCDYPVKEFDCAPLGKVCIDAECVFPDTPCSPNPCYDAPEPHCKEDSATMVEFKEPGNCEIVGEDGVCEYEAVETDCAQDDKVCWKGACFDESELCEPNPCEEPPPDECLGDGLTLNSYQLPGACTVVDLKPVCEYDALLVDCEKDGLQCINDVCGIEGQGNTPTEYGQVVVTEFMARSQAGSDLGEWVELYNASDQFLDLNGCIMLDDGSDSHVIESVLVFEPGDYLVLARSDDPEDNHGLETDYVYAGYNLSNDEDEVVLECSGIEIDRVDFTDDFVEMGVAAQLDPENYDPDLNDSWDYWCLATKEYGDAGMLGTPGWPNSDCQDDPCLDNPCTEPPPAECDDAATLITYPEIGACQALEGQAVCTYVEIPVNCQDDGKICQEGACVEGPTDPCDPNPCTQPPPAECDQDGLNLTTYPETGECTVELEAAVCDYPPQTVECWVQGLICKNEACVPEGQGNTPTLSGQIVITEFMAKSEAGNSDDGEWVELYNSTDGLLDLDGCLLKDMGSDSAPIDETLIIGPGAHLVLGRSADLLENHGLIPDFVYSGFILSNTTDEIVLQCGDVVVDSMAFTSEAALTGVAFQLDPDAYDATLNDLPANWCAAVSEYGTDPLLGTPGQDNTQCPEVDLCNPNPCDSPDAAVCDADGVTLHAFETPGVCTVVEDAPQCSYTPKDVNCADDSKVCLLGVCVEQGATPPPSTPGQVIVTEFMARSQEGSSDNGEWLELYNKTDSDLDLKGCFLLDDGSNSFQFADSVLIKAGEYLALGKSGDAVANHGLPVDFVYSGYTLSNTDDEIVLKCGETEIDRVNFTATWVLLGVAIQLDPDALDHELNNSLDNWCPATTPYGTADKKGTPGEANIQCPGPLAVPWCRLQWPTEITTTEGATHDVFCRVFVAGVTDLTDGVDENALVKGELGWGPDATDPADNQDWTWVSTLPTPDWSGQGNGEAPNDEYKGVLTAPAAGAYDYAFRFTSDGEDTWVYCDRDNGFEHDGSEDGYQPDMAGTLVVEQ